MALVTPIPPAPHPYTAEGGSNEKITLQVNGEYACKLLWVGARYSANVDKELTITYVSPLGGKYNLRAYAVTTGGKKWAFWAVPFDFRLTAEDYIEVEAEAGGVGVTCTITAMVEPLQGADNPPYARIIQGEVTQSAQTATIGTIPPNATITELELNVTLPFDSDSGNLLSIGHDADHAAYGQAIDVGVGGRKTIQASITAGDTPITVKGYYTAGGSEPTVGSVRVIVRYEA